MFNEDEIKEKYKLSYTTFNKHLLNTPSLQRMSYHKPIHKRVANSIHHLKKPMSGPLWDNQYRMITFVLIAYIISEIIKFHLIQS